MSLMFNVTLVKKGSGFDDDSVVIYSTTHPEEGTLTGP